MKKLRLRYPAQGHTALNGEIKVGTQVHDSRAQAFSHLNFLGKVKNKSSFSEFLAVRHGENHFT